MYSEVFHLKGGAHLSVKADLLGDIDGGCFDPLTLLV